VNFRLTSTSCSLTVGAFYLGWDSDTRSAITVTDCGDEMFGFGVGRLYVGCYSGTGWCAGFLNEFGCLD
jgi:hypothetical protein